MQMLTKLYDQQRATTHTGVRGKQSNLKRGNQNRDTRSARSCSTHSYKTSCYHHLKSGTETTTESVLPITAATRTFSFSGLQTTLFSAAAHPNTRPPSQTTSPQPQRHTASNFTPTKTTHFQRTRSKKTRKLSSSSRDDHRDPTTRKDKHLGQLITCQNAVQVEFDHRIKCAWARATYTH